jgi:monoamine oxidase
VPTSTTRRQFLRKVGIAGGAGALFATMGALELGVTSDAVTAPFAPPSPADFTLTGRAAGRVTVLGAGVAGLACAYELGKAGYDCTVLEAQPSAGGRNFTVRSGTTHTDLAGITQTATFADGQYFNAGPGRIAQWMVTVDYCRELGVPLEIFANSNADAYFYQEGAGMIAGHPVRRRTAKSDTFGYIAELLAKSTDQGALDRELTPQDKERLVEFLRQFGGIVPRPGSKPATGWAYRGGPQRGYRVWPGSTYHAGIPAGPVPPLSAVLSYEIGEELAFETDFEQAMVMLQPVGGMDAIVSALLRKVGPTRVILGSPVTSITTEVDRVRVTYRDQLDNEQVLDGDYCIVTMPPTICSRLAHNLGPEVQRALAAYRPEPVGKIGLEYRTRWWESDHRIYGGITETDLDIDQIWYPSHGFHSARGILVGYYTTGKDAIAYGSLPPAAREARALSHGVRIHGPKHRDELASSFSIAWERVPFVEGGWQNIPGGPQAPVYAPLNAAAGRVYFAGDWLSNQVSWQHGSFVSAQRAVTALHARVMTT